MDWAPIPGFPGYSVSDTGKVRRDKTELLLAASVNQQGIPNVPLQRDGQQFKRSLPLLVAKAFLHDPINQRFDTPIHLDGDRLNNHVENLMWRPRWFAVKYHRQFKEGEPKGFLTPIYEEELGLKFDNAMEAAMRFGLLVEEITYSIVNGIAVFPTYQTFREWVE